MTHPHEAVAAKLNDSGLAEQLAGDFTSVEDILRSAVLSDCATVERVGSDLVLAGGKRLRPMLVVLAARACGRHELDMRVYQAAAATELIHMATLIHDDVVDEAATRRGRPTAFSLFGRSAAVLSGDVLLARAMELLAEAGDIEVIRVISRAVVAMAEGEVREVETRGNFELTQSAHFEILRLKTAEFMAACCDAGGILSDASPTQRRALAAYGLHVGLAFQIVDDILDYAGDPGITGKPRGTDLIEGCATLPLILMRERAGLNHRDQMVALFGNPSGDAEAIADLAKQMRSMGVLDEAERAARDHISQALAAVRSLPENEARSFLEEVTELVLARKS
jgi:octaprenyl-diphosphate synthase